MRWPDSTHGERLKSDKICLTLAKKPGELIWGYLWGHFWRLAAQTIDSLVNVIVAASTNSISDNIQNSPQARLTAGFFLLDRPVPSNVTPYKPESGGGDSWGYPRSWFNPEGAVGRSSGCAPRGVQQGTKRRNSEPIPTSRNAAGRRAGRAPAAVAPLTLWVTCRVLLNHNKHGHSPVFCSGQLLLLGSRVAADIRVVPRTLCRGRPEEPRQARSHLPHALGAQPPPSTGGRRSAAEHRSPARAL